MTESLNKYVKMTQAVHLLYVFTKTTY